MGAVEALRGIHEGAAELLQRSGERSSQETRVGVIGGCYEWGCGEATKDLQMTCGGVTLGLRVAFWSSSEGAFRWGSESMAGAVGWGVGDEL